MLIKSTTAFFTNREGIKLYTRRYVPAEARALMVVVHGFGEHSGRYEHFIDYFGRHGYAVAMFDLRGHGLTEGVRGDVDRFESWVTDVRQFVAEMRRTAAGNMPVILVGHSLGGLIGLDYLSRHSDEVEGAVISAPALNPTVDLPAWQKWIGTRAARWLPQFTIPAAIDPQQLTRDTHAVSAYIDDPLVLKRITLRAGKEIMDGAGTSASWAESISCPLLMLQAADDRVCGAEATRAFYKRVREGNKKLIMYDGAFHEAFNDIIKEQVFADVEHWLGGVVIHWHTAPMAMSPYVVPIEAAAYASKPLSKKIMEFTVRAEERKTSS